MGNINSKYMDTSKTASRRMADARADAAPRKESHLGRNVMVTAVGAGALFLASHNPLARGGDGPRRTLTTEVRPGNTEWSLATSIRPNSDPRATIEDLDKLIPNDSAHQNHNVQPGDTVTYTSDGKILSYKEAGDQ